MFHNKLDGLFQIQDPELYTILESEVLLSEESTIPAPETVQETTIQYIDTAAAAKLKKTSKPLVFADTGTKIPSDATLEKDRQDELWLFDRSVVSASEYENSAFYFENGEKVSRAISLIETKDRQFYCDGKLVRREYIHLVQYKKRLVDAKTGKLLPVDAEGIVIISEGIFPITMEEFFQRDYICKTTKHVLTPQQKRLMHYSDVHGYLCFRGLEVECMPRVAKSPTLFKPKIKVNALVYSDTGEEETMKNHHSQSGHLIRRKSFLNRLYWNEKKEVLTREEAKRMKYSDELNSLSLDDRPIKRLYIPR